VLVLAVGAGLFLFKDKIFGEGPSPTGDGVTQAEPAE
jgi:hypothetical protein